MKRALILTDGKAGHENQSRAAARALGCAADVLPVAFKSTWAKAVSYAADKMGILSAGLFEVKGTLPAAKPDVVIGTGSGTFYAAKCLAKRLGTKCAVVLYPRGYRLGTFDCILAPAFDRPKPAANVIEIPSNLVAADAAFYEQGVAAFREHYARTTGRAYEAAALKPVAVIVGGPNGCSTLEASWMKDQIEKIFAATPGAPHWVTTSRRTPAEVDDVIDGFDWDYKLVYARDHFNPVPAFVVLAGTLYVTAESTGMLSEACTSGTAEVRVLDNLKPGDHKFRRFAQTCAAMKNRKFDLTQQYTKAKELLCLS